MSGICVYHDVYSYYVVAAAGIDVSCLFERHTNSHILLSSVALIVQIHLQQNRTDLALKEVQAARRWAQDSLLVNLAESWVGLRVVWLEIPR